MSMEKIFRIYPRASNKSMEKNYDYFLQGIDFVIKPNYSSPRKPK